MSTTSLIISRHEISLPDLELHAPGAGFRVIGQPMFSRPTLIRDYPSESSHVNYSRPVNIRKGNGSYDLRVLASADSAAELEALLDVLEAAFSEQYEFTLRHTYGGLTRTWSCIAADINFDSRDRDFDASMARKFKQPVTFTGPHMGRIQGAL